MRTATTTLLKEEAPPLTAEEHTHILLGQQFFWYFLDSVFVRSFDGLTYTDTETGLRLPFEFSSLHREWALLAQANPRMCLMAPRNHLKTTVLGQAFPAWLMATAEEGSFVDGMYFSYKAELADEKVATLKRLIKNNPFFRHWRDRKPNAESIIDFLVDWGKGPVAEVTLQGSGIMSATRGRHPKFTICDDILSDFTNPLDSADLRLINRIFNQTIMSLPSNPDDPLILVGTPQSYDDVLYTRGESEDWLWLTYPAIKDFSTREVQWPEKYNFERLLRLRSSSGIGRTPFEVEYQLAPVTLADQYFSQLSLSPIVDPDLVMWDLTREFSNPAALAVYGGLDVGKKVHPSHVSILVEMPNGSLVVLFQAFMDHMPYPRQIALLNFLAKRFNLTRGYYDATYNVLDDRGLDRRWRGKVFQKKAKASLATGLEKRVYADEVEPGLVLVNDQRFIGQICQVRKDLTAPDTADGHGDAFWSLSLSVQAAADGPTIVDIGGATPLRVQDPTVPRLGMAPRAAGMSQFFGGARG